MERFAPARGSGDRSDQSSHCRNSSRDLFYGSGCVLRKQHEIIGLSVSTSESRSQNLDIHRRRVGGVARLMAEPPRSLPQRFRYRRTGLNR
jgi:hypothetical protein